MSLRIEGVTRKFGGLRAVDNVHFNVPQGQIAGLIGPNGSGKTTLLNLIHRIYDPDAGSIYLNEERLNRLTTHQISRRGIGRMFQATRLWRRMSVMENMLTPAFAVEQSTAEARSRAAELLEFTGLQHLKDHYASDISGGQQRLLEFARMLMLKPRVLLMDEPFVGVHPALKAKMIENIRTISCEGKTFVIVSHDLASVFGLCDRIAVMDAGAKIADGTGDEIRNNPSVVEAYLGV